MILRETYQRPQKLTIACQAKELHVTRQCNRGACRFCLFSAARSRRDRRAVRARTRVAEERTDFVRRFGGQDVFELAGLLLDFGFAIHGERIGKESFSKAMSADDV